jgi:hypothetical protein
MASISRNDIPASCRIPFSAITGRDDVSTIWAVNTSGDVADGLPSDVVIVVRHLDGSVTPVVIQQAAIAIDVTSLAPREALVKSSHFINAVSKGMLTLVTEEYASRTNDGAVAQSEYARLHQRQAAIDNVAKDVQSVAAGSSREHRSIEVVRRADAPGTSQRAANAQSSPKIDLSAMDLMERAETVSPSFVSWVDSTNLMELKQAIAAFVARGTVQPHEAEYIIANTVHERIKAFLKDKA